jgi:beta-xylosidase
MMMRLVLALGILCAAAGFRADAAEKLYTNPVLAGDHPDPSVIRVGRDYWAVATSSEWSPTFPMLHSRDLVNWEEVGPVFSHRPGWATGFFWAPEIVKYRNGFYIYYSARLRKGGPLSIGVAVSEKPQGPYNDLGVLMAEAPGNIDPVMFEDEKGDPYLIWKEDGNSRNQPTVIYARRLADSGVAFKGPAIELIRNDASWEGGVVEAPFILRRGDYFYMFYSGNGCCGTGCNYALGVARARSLLGPWEKNPHNPILASNDEWKCPGHGSIVDDPSGRHWLMYHAYARDSSVFTGRQALVDEVKFTASGWPLINRGNGPGSGGPSPFGLEQHRKELNFVDEFTSSKLHPGWSWPVSDDPPAHTYKGEMILRAVPNQGTNFMGAIVGRSISTGDFAATTTLRRSSVAPGVHTGLAALGDRANSVGLSYIDNRIMLWSRRNGKTEVLSELDAPKAKALHFRLTSVGGKDFQFAVSDNGREWTDVSPAASGVKLPPLDRAIRVGLAVGGAPITEVAYERFKIEAR